MGDHPRFLATYPCHTYTNMCYKYNPIKNQKPTNKNNDHRTTPHTMSGPVVK